MQQQFTTLCIQRYSSKAVDVKKQDLSNSLCLRQIQNRGNTVNRPLVLFFPWLTATPRALDRYCNLYHERGWDVLTIKGHLKDFTWPPCATKVTKEVIDLLTLDKINSDRPLVVQGMSVGAYLFSVFMIEVQKDALTFNNISPRIRAQIFDSIVIGSLGRMSTGMAIALTKNPILQKLIVGSSSAYFTLMKKHTVAFYNEAIRTFYENPFQGGVLFFYSHSDPMCDPEAMEQLVDTMRGSGRFNISTKSWQVSPHAGHLRTHPEGYLKVLNEFLAKAELD